MSITDELREYVNQTPVPKSKVLMEARERFNAIADRIDAEHKKACDDAWDNGYEADYLGIEKWLTEHPQVMEHHGWIRLPKDADGEYIHVGDEMCGYGWPNGGVYCRAIVNEVTILVGPQDGAYRGWLMWAANECRHHHAPTVEDVLREFAEKMNENLGMYTGEAIDADEWRSADAKTIAEYASKLRLAERED